MKIIISNKMRVKIGIASFAAICLFIILHIVVTPGPILKNSDISIYNDNFDLIRETMTKNRHLNSEWDNYISKMYNHYRYYRMFLSEYEAFDDYKKYKTEMNGLLDCEVPDELKDIFNKIGWGNNGNKKFWTIFLGHRLLDEKETMVVGNLFILALPILLFDKDIREGFKNINNQYKIIKKALKIFNNSDLIKIKKEYNTVKMKYISIVQLYELKK